MFPQLAYKRWGHLGFLERGNIRKGGGGGWPRKGGGGMTLHWWLMVAEDCFLLYIILIFACYFYLTIGLNTIFCLQFINSGCHIILPIASVWCFAWLHEYGRDLLIQTSQFYMGSWHTYFFNHVRLVMSTSAPILSADFLHTMVAGHTGDFQI